MEARKGDLIVAQLAAKHGFHHMMISTRRKQAVDGMASVYSGKAEAPEASREAEVEKLHAKISKLMVERDFLALPRISRLSGGLMEPSVDEPGPEARHDRAGPSPAVDRGIDFLAERIARKFIEQRPVEAFEDPGALWRFQLAAGAIDFPNFEAQHILVPVIGAAVFRAAIGQHAIDADIVGSEEGEDAILD